MHGCTPESPPAGPPVIRVAAEIAPDRIVSAAGSGPAATASVEGLEWRFDEAALAAARERADEAAAREAEEAAVAEDDPAEGEAAAAPETDGPDLAATNGFEAFLDVEELSVRGGLLTGRTGSVPVLLVGIEAKEASDDLYAVEIRLRVSAGKELGLRVDEQEKLERKELELSFRRSNWRLKAPLTPGPELQTVVVDLSSQARRRIRALRHLFLRPTDAEGATFEIESVRLVPRREALAKIPAGASWQGLGEVYRESLVLRAPAEARLALRLPAHPWLDLAVGTIEPDPVTFRVQVLAGEGEPTFAWKHTVTTPDRWEEAPIDLSRFAGRTVELILTLESGRQGTLGFFGSPVVRERGAPPAAAAAGRHPRGVILVLADTLRRDHLEAYGYERETAPNLARLAREGALFADGIAQGSWTKVSVPSILSSLYPSTNGIVNASDRLPDSVTTLEEAFQTAGSATFATSSVPFSGKLSNLQQGLDVLHERSSLPEVEHSGSKTARVFVDRLLEWVEAHEDGSFYARLHVFDPHSPFEPYAPYDALWSEDGAQEAHEADVKKVEAFLEGKGEPKSDMPRKSELIEAGVTPEDFVARELDWYDASIRAFDVELGRLLERLEQRGLADEVLIALVADHGEEFLEHGRHFHGETTYGEMTNVPLILWGPAWVPGGTRVEETVQSIDLMPTLLELAGLPIPVEAQGQSLVPLLGGPGAWHPRPAFSERRRPDFERVPEPDDVESFSIVDGGFRLVHNVTRPEGVPEFQLYDHRADPLNANDLAPAMPERVAELAEKLRLWRAWAEAARIEGGGADELSAADLEELRKLGYAR